MKTFKLLPLALIGAMALAGCEEKNEEYFLKNIDAATEKLEQCTQDFKKAFMAKDKNAAEKVSNNPECLAAESAIKKDKQLKDEQEKQRKEAEQKQAIDSAMADIQKQINGLTWTDVIEEYLKIDECKKALFSSTSGNPKCVAWETIFKEKVDEGKKELKQLSFDQLKTKMTSLCKLDKRTISNCSIAQEALQEKATEELANDDLQTIKAKEPIYCADDLKLLAVCRVAWNNAWQNQHNKLVKFYTQNNTEFVTTYNACIDKLEQVKAENSDFLKGIQLEETIRQTYPCRQVKDAYIERGIGYAPFEDGKLEQ